MDLVPFYKKEGNRIGIDPAKGKLLGLTSEAARIITISKTVRLPARVASDNDLYLSQQEYLLSFNNPGGKADILEASKFRMMLLGYADTDIKELEKQAKPDKALLIPGEKAWLFVDVYENDLQSVKPGKEVIAVTDTFPSIKFRGKVMFVEPALNPETRAAKARIMVDNTDKLLKLEMFASVEIKTSQGPLLAVPKTAVIDTGIRKVAYIDYANGEYEPRDIKTGFAGDEYVEIKEGLKKGDLVVTNGNFMLDSESQLRGSTAQSGAMEGMDMSGKK
jgi:multidrug efflux pump subunit AcrA (membrane-fusion protein)